MNFSQGVVGVWLQRTVDAPPREVLRRISAATRSSDVPRLRVGVAAPGTLVAASRRYPVERDGVAVAWVELTPLTPSATLLEVAAEEPGAAAIVEQIATAVCGPALPARRAATSRGLWRHRVARVVAVAAVLTLVAGSAAAYRLLAPPEPLAVDQAVAQFHDAQAAAPVPTTEPSQAARPSAPTAAAAPARVDRVQRQPAATGTSRRRPAGRERTRRVAIPQQQPAAADDAEGTPQPPRQREPAARPAPMPAAGVYTYATSGHEKIDQPSDRHDYPERTALTLHHTGCGFTTRWQPLEERWDETEICTGEVRTLARMTTHRAFFGQRKRSEYRCDPGSRAWHTKADARWKTRCSDGDTTVTTQFRMLGYERVAVGDEVVRAVHLRLRSTLSGGTRGQWAADRWLHPETGLLLRLEASTDATSMTPFGDVRYREQVRLDLQSLQPQR